MKENKAFTATLADLVPDDKNANSGTERGNAMIEASLRKYGAGRSILIDKNGKIIAGNKTVENAGALGIDEVIIVKSDGRQIVAVQRTDLDMDGGPEARELAIADNRAGEINLEWDAANLDELAGEIDLSPFFSDSELKEITGRISATDLPGLKDGDKEPFQQMAFILHDAQVEQVNRALARAAAMGAFDGPNTNKNGNCLARICETFLTQNGER